ncbi:DUF1343 domain-containing protein [Thermoactinomyces sp. AMNI-1]|uniref:DUF1343 domain-containing protein n=2 Tax=Thermoactinomyces mirandus TaxID=2756294 RepID=A0A7W1XQD3_9BACL|nr:DUF1343 domain-containing protein [Thermoactinomyces mirandus]
MVLAGVLFFCFSDKNDKTVVTGLEQVLADPEKLQGKRVGLITNPTGIASDYRHGLDALLARGIRVTKVFGPEHGIRGTEQAGEKPGSMVDPKTKIGFEDLYGKTPEEIVPLFREVDVLVFDLQDIGTRYYTYIYTMANAMEAAGISHKPFYVLDRPNPIGGKRVEGPVLKKGYESSVGRFPIPLRHGMTVGELALLFNDQIKNKADLHVVRMKGWTRDKTYEETGLPWIMPSPNIPTLLTACAYPGLGLIEGTNLSEGRGTTRPFELIGAPYIRGWELAAALNQEGLPGVFFREAYFTPVFSKYEGETVGGVQLHITDCDRFDPVLTGIAIIEKTGKLYPGKFAWVKSGERYWIDLLAGTDQLRLLIGEGKSAKEIVRQWNDELNKFKEIRKRYLLYK